MSKAKNQTQNQKNDTKFLAVVISGMEMEGSEKVPDLLKVLFYC